MTIRGLAICAIGLLVAAHAALAAEGQREFVLRDYLNRRWQNELVTYRVDDLGAPAEALRLYGPDGRPVPVQIWDVRTEGGKTSACVSFKANVEPFGASTYALRKGAEAAPATDLKVEEGGGRIRLLNGLTGVEIAATAQEAAAGPIRAVRLRSGAWVGKGQMAGKRIQSCEARVVAKGPVFAEAVCRCVLAGGGTWEMRARLIAGEPVVLVDERFDFEAADASWLFQLNAGFGAESILARGWSEKSASSLAQAAEGNVCVLAPWAGWWGGNTLTAFGLFGSKSDDLLLVSAREPASWANPLPRSMDPWTRCNRALDVHVPVRVSKGSVEMVFPFPKNGRARSWMLAALSKAEALKEEAVPLPLRLHIQYGKVPLDKVKDYVLEWPQTEEHPRLFVARTDMERVGKMGNPDAAEGDVFKFFATGDQAVGRKIAGDCSAELQAFVDQFTQHKGWEPKGDSRSAHRSHAVINPTDAILGAPFLSEKERNTLRAQLAFIAYQMESPDVCSPERGWSANPNMTCNWYCGLGKLSCLLYSHPHARRWFDRAYEEVRRELDTWAGPNGEWLEAPHYMTVSIDTIVPFAIAAKNSGYADLVHDPQLKKTMLYLAKIATPPDPDCGWQRLSPAVGNTYHGETTSLHGWAAKLWADRDADYSAEMQWMWMEQGKMRYTNIGGGNPGMAYYRPLLLDPNLPQRAPQWGSELFPAVGAVFRSSFPSQRETYLLLRQGPFAEHWDHDEGSIVLYGKGRPLVRDFSYNPYTPHSWLHNRVANNHSDGQVSWDEWATVQAFASLGHTDYSRGRQYMEAGQEGPIKFSNYQGDWPFRQKEPNGPVTWERQILFVKEDDAAQPSYFVIADTTEGKSWVEWCMWFTAAGAPDLTRNPVGITGQQDVNAQLFFALPARPHLSTLHAEQKGLGPKISQELVHLAQPAGTPIVAVIYPYIKGQEEGAQFAAMANGRAVRVEGKFGRDINVVSRDEVTLEEAGVALKARAASVQDRAGRLTLALPEGGTVSFGGYVLKADGAASVEVSKARHEIVVRTDGAARQLRLTTPLDPELWEETSQNASRVEGKELVITLPKGWESLRLTAP